MKAVAIEQGMKTLRDDGLAEGRVGLTVHRRDREGGEVIEFRKGEEQEVQIPIPELLEAVLERGASDLHLPHGGTPPTIRCTATSSAWTSTRSSTPAAIQGMIYAILPQKMRERLEQELELDMSYSLPGRRGSG